LAPNKIYTGRKPDPKPIAFVFDPEKLLHKRKERVVDSGIFLDRNLSFPKDGVKIIDDLYFDIKFEQNLFRYNQNLT
jgi:hypothetical protein